MNCNSRSSTLVPSSERVNVISEVLGISDGNETNVPWSDSKVKICDNSGNPSSSRSISAM